MDHYGDEDISWLPGKPTEPLPGDCCGSGCTPCVFDIYEDELRLWEEERKKGPPHLRKEDESASDKDTKPVLSSAQYTSFTIDSITRVSSDTAIFRFKLPSNKSLGLSVGQHIILKGQVGTESITRQYTPISPLNAKGYFDVLIKIYKDGKMSSYVKTWKVDDHIEVRGPFGQFTYRPNKYRRIVMLAAGTGVAPMLQVIREIVLNEEEETFVHLVYCCRTYQEILMKSTLDDFTDYWNFTVLYVLSQEMNTKSHRYGEQVHYGRMDETLVVKETSPVKDDTMILICGTKSFDKDMIKYLTKSGYSSKNYFKF
ncbi:NADH-cytochrome b5 reductase-like [Ptychodera flava]|uniref:NADH-cytochrome b5 reductase-like n=1 Tax=Ptychodera flava TaxID=63121 RepID=UPI00396A08F6